MNDKYKTFEELKEEFGEGYENILYEMGIDAMEKIEYLQDELQRKDNNWNELKEWLDNRSEFTNMGAVLDKIKELENGK